MSTAAEEPLMLYRLQACPYCERVVRVLQAHGVPYESRFVEARHSRRNVVKRLTGKRTVPAVHDPNTGVTMSESANIVEYLETTYGEHGGRVPGATDAAEAKAQAETEAEAEATGGE